MSAAKDARGDAPSHHGPHDAGFSGRLAVGVGGSRMEQIVADPDHRQRQVRLYLLLCSMPSVDPRPASRLRGGLENLLAPVRPADAAAAQERRAGAFSGVSEVLRAAHGRHSGIRGPGEDGHRALAPGSGRAAGPSRLRAGQPVPRCRGLPPTREWQGGPLVALASRGLLGRCMPSLLSPGQMTTPIVYAICGL